MRIFEWIAITYGKRQSTLEDPTQGGFKIFKTVNNITLWCFKETFHTYIHMKEKIIETETQITYTDQNPKGITYEAHEVNSGITPHYHIAWTWLKNDTIGFHWLGKVHHIKGIELLKPTIITNNIPDNLGPYCEIRRSDNSLHIAIPLSKSIDK